jgi:hypothetical protein
MKTVAKKIKASKKVMALLAQVYAYRLYYYTEVCPNMHPEIAAQFAVQDCWNYCKNHTEENQIGFLECELEDYAKAKAKREAQAAVV